MRGVYFALRIPLILLGPQQPPSFLTETLSSLLVRYGASLTKLWLLRFPSLWAWMLREALILTTSRGKLEGICGSNLLHRSILNLVINIAPFQWFSKWGVGGEWEFLLGFMQWYLPHDFQFCKDRSSSPEHLPHVFQILNPVHHKHYWGAYPQCSNQGKSHHSQNFHSKLLICLFSINFIMHCCFHHCLLHKSVNFSVAFCLYTSLRVLGVMPVNW